MDRHVANAPRDDELGEAELGDDESDLAIAIITLARYMRCNAYSLARKKFS